MEYDMPKKQNTDGKNARLFIVPGQQPVKLSPNQFMLIINKPACDSDFLQMKNEYWKKAARNMKDAEFKLYCYCSANMDKFQIAFSPQHISNELGLTVLSISNARKGLEKMGYIYRGKNSSYPFLEFFVDPSLNPNFKSGEVTI